MVNTEAGGAEVSIRAEVRSERSEALRAKWREFRSKLHRAAGRALIGLPASSWMLFDVWLVATGVYFAYTAVPPPTAGEFVTPHIALWQAMAIFAFAVIISSLVFGLYERETLRGRSRILTRMVLAAAAATVIVYAIVYVIMYATVARRVTGLAMSTLLFGGISIRWFACSAIHAVPRGLLVVGPRSLFDSFDTARREGLLAEYRLIGYAEADRQSEGSRSDPLFVGGIREQVSNLGLRNVTDIVVSAPVAAEPASMNWIVPCLQSGCRVTDEATFYEKATGQILVGEITPSWFLQADLKTHCEEQATLKRFLDLCVAGIALLVSLPLWPVIALAIRLCDRGPVFYSQDRVGQNGKVFRLYKFRTMREGAENGKSVWSSPNDPRITPVGHWLRRSRLDELPQLCNVLRGDMSIVGPRPERPDLVEELRREIPFYGERHLVKPGITGWAQISFRYGSSTADAKRKLQFDLYYVKEMSFELDAIILFRTLGTFLRGAC